MNSFHLPFSNDRTDEWGGLLFYIQEDISCKEIMVTLETNIDVIFVEFNLRGENGKAKMSNFLSCNQSK